MSLINIGSLLTRRKDAIFLEDDTLYKRVTIRTKNQGLELRDIEKGSQIGTKNQFLIKSGQFLLSKIDARYGAFGIVPMDLDNAIITGNFWAFDVDTSRLNIEWFNLYTSSPHFIEICNQASSGTTNRRYLDEDKFLSHEINLPDVYEQTRMIERYKVTKEKFNALDLEINDQILLLSILNHSILQDAVKGKLVQQDSNDKPMFMLLKKIKADKARLISEKKLRNEKEAPPITEEEVPYELPNGWEWARLGEIVELKNGSIRRGPFGSAIRKDMFVAKAENTYKVYEQGNAIRKSIDYGDYYVNEAKFNELRSFEVEAGDIIISCAGTIGESYLLPDNAPRGIINQALLKLRLNNEVIRNDYFLYLFKSLTQIELNEAAQGSAMKNLVSIDFLKNNVVFPIPPIEEQKRIVEKVDRLIALNDALIKSVNQSKQESEMLMQAVLQEVLGISENEKIKV